MSKYDDRCRLYLLAPARPTARHKQRLVRAVSLGLPASVLLTDNGKLIENGKALEKVPDGARTDSLIDGLIDAVQGAGVACLLETPEAAAEHGADGVHIAADPALYARSRDMLGPSASIGVACGRNRHEAMQLAEAGADYVAFGSDGPSKDETLELVAWWSQMFVVPNVVFGVETVDEAARFAQSGADFVAPGETIWEEDGVIDMLIEMDRAIAANMAANRRL